MLDIQNLERDLTDLLLHNYGVVGDKLNSEGTIPRDSSLHKDLSLSLISILRLRIDINTYYRVIIPDEDAIDLKTFGDITKYIREHCKGE